MVERLSAVVGARISEFKRKMAEVKAVAKTVPNTIVVNVKARTDAAQAKLDALADTLRTFQTVGASVTGGAFFALSPTAVPTLAVLAAGLATLGPMLGVMGGGMLGLASSFGLAAVAAAGFGAAMYPLIFDIKNARSQLLEGEKALEDFSKPMQHVQLALIALRGTFKNLTNAIEPHALQAIGTSMYVLADIITALKPGIVAVAKTFEKLMTDLRGVVQNADDVQASFAWFNDRAAGAVEAWAKIAGYAFRGFVNLLRAFDPLAQSTEKGLLNMTKRFSEWTAGLSKSEKFQKFISYVKENGPKLLDIFGNITGGLVGMFTAFAPMSADMMTGLQKLTQRFQEWGQSLSENKSFQEFIQYVRENTPKVLSLISELTTFLVNLAVGMAPLGSKILELVTGFLSWSNSIMEAHPWTKKLFGVVLVLTGVLKMLVPFILAASVLFKGLGTTVLGLLSRFLGFKVGVMGVLRLIGQSIVSAVITYKGAFASLGNILWMVLSKIGMFFNMLISSLANMLGILAKELGKFALRAFQWAGRVILSFGRILMAAGPWLGRMLLTFGKIAGRYAWLAVRALASAARVAASFLIAMGPVGWVIATVIALVALIIWKWDEIKKWTVKIWNAVWNWIKDTWEKVWNKTKEIASNIYNWVKNKFSDMKDAIHDKLSSAWDTIQNIWGKVMDFFRNIDLFDMGADIIRGLINGIGSMASSLVKKAKGIVGDAIGAAKSLLGINSPSRVFMEIGHFTGEGFAIGMEKTARMVASASKAMTGASIPTPAMNKSSFDVNHHVRDDYEPKEEVIIIEMNGREVARGTKEHMKEFMDRDSGRKVTFA